MLKRLHIKNLATIEEVELSLKKGFTILTGETGAGKSIIIDGVRLILGERGTAEMIRTGERQTSVEAVIATSPSEKRSDREKEVFVQRVLAEKGSGRGYFNGILVPIKSLKERADEFVDIYGQNDHVFLRKSENQLDFLDQFAEALPIRAKTALSARELRTLLKEKKDLEEKEKDREIRMDFLQYQIKEMEEAALRPGEEEELHQERNLLKNAEKINRLIAEGIDISTSGEDAISPLLARLKRITADLTEFDKSLEETLAQIEQLDIVIREFSEFLTGFKEKQNASPEILEGIEERLSLIESLKRKYGTSIPEILSQLEKSRKELHTLDTNRERLDELESEIQKKFEEYRTLAHSLFTVRHKAARILEKELEREIGHLGMTKARVNVDVKTLGEALTLQDRIKDTGTEEVEFLISPNPGEELKPLRRIASGGELSRIMLALKSIGKDKEGMKTLIFDEIDSGIGGKVADFVARKLKKLAARNQVLCITHLPQIASSAEHHFKIEKKIENDRTYTTVKELSYPERIEEVARLMSGRHVTQTAMKSAEELIASNWSPQEGDTGKEKSTA